MEEQAARLRADASHYGLDGSALTNRTDVGLPFGGFKQSSVGREGGEVSLLPCLEMKAILIDALPGGV